jgi:hypothetical protein
MSTIEERKNEKLNNNNNVEKQSNWGAFGVNVIYNFILTLFIGILGANVIFLSSSSSTFLEIIIPKKSGSYFTEKYKNNPVLSDSDVAAASAVEKEKNKQMYDAEIAKNKKDAEEDAINSGGAEKYTGNKENNCNRSARNGSNTSFNLFDFKNSGNWPYTLRDPNVGTINFIQKFLNWILETMYGAYSINRGFLQSWLSIFSKKNSGFISNDTFIMLIIAPLTLLAAPLALGFGFFSSLFSAFFIGYTQNNTDMSKSGWIWALIGLFLGYTWILTSSISFLQFIQYILLFTLFPILKNFSKIKNILHCNSTTLGLLFGALVCSSAFAHLDNITSMVMTVVYILMAIKALW